MTARNARPSPLSLGGRFGFLRLVLILFVLILGGLLLWLRLSGGTGGSLPFDYDGFG